MSREPTLTLHAEELQVTRQKRDAGSVSVTVATHHRDHAVDETLTSTGVDVRHVQVGRVVDQMPQSRQEGDTLIIPVVEEVVVVRYLIREEIHLIRTTDTRRHQEIVSLRTEQAVVKRSDAGDMALPSRKLDNPEDAENAQ